MQSSKNISIVANTAGSKQNSGILLVIMPFYLFAYDYIIT